MEIRISVRDMEKMQASQAGSRNGSWGLCCKKGLKRSMQLL